MRKVLLILAGLLVVALAALLVLPGFWDWNRYRGEIAAKVESWTGRDFAIEGDVRLSLLPAPSLAASGLRLANPPGFSAPDMATVRELRVRLALWPLLRGEVRAESVELIGPAVHLERRADGRVNWDFARGAAAPPDGAGQGLEQGPERGGGLSLRLDSAVLRDGAIDYRRPGGLTRIAGLDGRLAAESLDGPFRGDGRMAVNGEPVAFEFRSGRTDLPEAQPLSATVEFPEAKAKLQFSGTGAPGPDGLRRVAGRLQAAAGNAARLVQAIGAVAGEKIALRAGPAAQAGSLEAHLTASADAVTLDDLLLLVGETRASGRAVIALGPPLGIDAALATARLDLDAWLADAPAGAVAPVPVPGAASSAPTSAAAAPKTALPDLRARLDLAAEAVQFRGGLLREARLRATLQDGIFDIAELTAQLPGAAGISFAGTVPAGAPQPRFDGRFEAKAGNLRGTLDWLGLDPPAVPADRLRSLAASGRLALDGEAARISDLTLQIDATRTAGAIAVALTRRPSFSASLRADRINLDAYLPPAEAGSDPAASPGPTSPGPTAGRPNPPSRPPLALLRDFDANLDLRVDQLNYRQTPVQRFRLDAALFEGKLEIRQAGFAEMAGMQASIAASLDGLGGSPRGRIAVDAAARDLARTLRDLEIDPPAVAEGLGAVTLKGEVAGGLDSLDLDLAFAAGETRARLAGGMQDLGKDPRYAVTLTAEDRSLGHVMALLAPERRLPQDPGPFALAAEIAGDAGAATVAKLTATLGQAHLSGSGSARWDGPVPVIRASLTADELTLDPFLAAGRAKAGGGGAAAGGEARSDRRWSSEPIDLALLRSVEAEIDLAAQAITFGKHRLDEARLKAAAKDGAFDIDDLKGRLLGGTVALDARLTAADPPAASIRLSISKADLRRAPFTAAGFEIVEGMLDAGLEIATSGRSEREMVAGLGGKASVAVRDGAVQGLDLKQAGERLRRIEDLGDILSLVTSAMTGGRTRFSSLGGSFAIAEGVAASNDLRLVAEAGEGSGTARIDLPAWRLDADAEFRLADLPQAPPIGVQLSGPIDHPQRRFRTERLQAHFLEQGIGGVMRGLLKDGAPPLPLPVPGLGQVPGPAPQAPPRTLRPEDAAKEIFRLFKR